MCRSDGGRIEQKHGGDDAERRKEEECSSDEKREEEDGRRRIRVRVPAKIRRTTRASFLRSITLLCATRA